MAAKTLDALMPDLPCDHDIEETIASFRKAIERSASTVWIQAFSIRGACRCCTYVRCRLLLARDKFVIKHGRAPVRKEEPEQWRCYRDLKRAVRLYAASKIQTAARGMLSRHAAPHSPSAPKAEGQSHSIEPRAPVLSQMLKQLALERELVGDGLLLVESPADQLHREKRRIKRLLREHAEAETTRTNAMAVEAVRPVYALYYQIKNQLGELDDANAGAEMLSPEKIDERRISELTTEMGDLQARLRKYEEAFVAAKGRKMKTRKEIAPVAEDYDRFREIKALLADLSSCNANNSE